MESLRYEGSPLGAWSLFLFGDVPGHQLDWIWRPSPSLQGPTPQHVQHLLALVRGFDVADPAASGLTVGNLSLLDSRHRPGRGALAILLHLRLPGSRDHSGRPNPPLVVALVASDGALPAEVIEGAASALLAWAEGGQPAGQRPIDRWYAGYVLAAGVNAEAAAEHTSRFMSELRGLPVAPPPTLECAWRVSEGEELPALIEIRADAPRPVVLRRMAGLAAELHRSRVRWSALSTMVPTQHGADQGLVVALHSASPADRPLRLVSRLPESPVEWARHVLGLVPAGEDSEPLPITAPAGLEPGEASQVSGRPAPPTLVPPLATGLTRPSIVPPPHPMPEAPPQRPTPPRPSSRWMIGSALGGLAALLLLLALRACLAPPPPAPRPTPVEAAPVEAAPVEAAPVEAAPVEAAPVGVPAPVEAAPSAAPAEPDSASSPPAPSSPRRGNPTASTPAAPAPAALVQGADGVDCALVAEGQAAAPRPIHGEVRLREGVYTLSCRLDGESWEEQRTVTLQEGSRWEIVCVAGQCAARRR